MTDYYTLLSRAVATLPNSTPEARRGLYERARAALLGQLRSVESGVNEADIQRENSALDEAIARLEATLLPRPVAAPLARPAASPPADKPALVDKPAVKVTPPIATPVKAATDNAAVQEEAASRRPARPRVGAPLAPKPAKPVSGPSRGRMLAIGFLVLLVAGGVAAVAIILPNPPFDGSKPRLADPTDVRTPDAKPAKLGDRIIKPSGSDIPAPAPDARQPAPQPAPAPVTVAPVTVAPVTADIKPPVPVAQRAAIVVRVSQEDNKVSTYIGSVVWRLDSVNSGPGQTLQNIVRADVDLPDAKMSVVVQFQNNKDAAFPASHTIKIKFNPASGSPIGTIKAIDVPEMREENTPSGTRLVGLVATIADNNFLAALAQGDQVVGRNLDLIRGRGWLDVPIQLGTGQIGKLVLEKGPPGDRAINDALTNWAN